MLAKRQPLSDELIDFTLARDGNALLLTLASLDGMNRLTSRLVRLLADEIEAFSRPGETDVLPVLPLVLSGFENFSAGADLNEISRLSGSEALEFARMGQRLMDVVDRHPAPVVAAIEGHCMGGGLDLALACDLRIAAPNAIFGHRGAALGLITGWGGTQRLPRLIGTGRALQMFAAAEKLHAEEALRIGLINEIAADPVARAIERLRQKENH